LDESQRRIGDLERQLRQLESAKEQNERLITEKSTELSSVKKQLDETSHLVKELKAKSEHVDSKYVVLRFDISGLVNYLKEIFYLKKN
jgi:chromosome segregation ATPase